MHFETHQFEEGGILKRLKVILAKQVTGYIENTDSLPN